MIEASRGAWAVDKRETVNATGCGVLSVRRKVLKGNGSLNEKPES